MRSGSRTALAAFAAAWLCAGGPAAASSLPLPPDVSESNVEGPAELVLGAQPTQMQMYATVLTMEGVYAFYDRELKKQGWQVGSMPWMAQLDAAHQRIDQEVAAHPEKLREPGVMQQLSFARSQRDALREHVKSSLYATRGSERLLLRFTPEEKMTIVSIHRWDSLGNEPAHFLGSQEASPDGTAGPALVGVLNSATGQPPAEATWPMASPCCTGQGVPKDLRQLPYSVPRYPNGRMLSSAALPDTGTVGAKIEMYASNDTLASVLGFYQSQMPQYGWSVDRTPLIPRQPGVDREGPMGVAAQQAKTETLMFRTNGAECLVVASEMPAMPDLKQYMDSVPPQQRAALPQTESELMSGGEKTVIVVTYMDDSQIQDEVDAHSRPASRPN